METTPLGCLEAGLQPCLSVIAWLSAHKLWVLVFMLAKYKASESQASLMARAPSVP